MTRGLEQLDVLLGEWVVASKKYSEGRGLTSVTRIEDGKFLRWESSEESDLFPRSTLMIGSKWEMSKDGKQWDVDFDLTYTKQ